MSGNNEELLDEQYEEQFLEDETQEEELESEEALDEALEAEEESDEEEPAEELEESEQEQDSEEEEALDEEDSQESNELPSAEPAPAEEETETAPEKLPARLAVIVGRLNDYIAKMAPGLPQAPGECAPRQANLYRMITGVLDLKGEEFLQGMDILIGSFKEHRDGVFHARYVARDFQNISLHQRERLAFERLIRLFQLAAVVKNPSDVHRHMDISLLLEVLPANMHQNILGYFPK